MDYRYKARMFQDGDRLCRLRSIGALAVSGLVVKRWTEEALGMVV